MLTSDGIAMLESAGVGGVFGFVTGFAVKKVIRWLAIAAGLLFAGLMVLSQRKLITVNWDQISNQTQSTAQEGIDYINSTIQKTAAQFHHSLDLTTLGTPVAGGSLFIAGFMGGLMKG